jgi:hypothetical protein
VMRQPARSNKAIVASCNEPFGMPSLNLFDTLGLLH